MGRGGLKKRRASLSALRPKLVDVDARRLWGRHELRKGIRSFIIKKKSLNRKVEREVGKGGGGGPSPGPDEF